MGSVTIALQNPLQDSLLLVVLLVITILAYFLMKHLRGKRATYFGNIKTLERTHGFRIFHVSLMVLIIKMVMIILLYMVATNTIMIKDYQPISDTDYFLLIDDSSSMAKSDYEPNRLASALEISNKWLQILPNSTGVGLAAFSKDIDVAVPFTHDKKLVQEAVNNITIDYTRSGTNLDYAIQYGIDIFEKSYGKKRSFLLLTDGTEDISNETIHKMIIENISIIIFGIGNADLNESFANVPEEYRDTYSTLAFNFTKLESIAKQTSGKAYQVSNKLELQESFDEATLESVQKQLDSGYYVILFIAIISILELLIYARLGAL